MSKQKRVTQQELQAFLSAYEPHVRQLVLKLRALVFQVVPAAVEQVDTPAKLLGYGFQSTYTHTICVIMPLKAAVNLGFPRGTVLPDPNHLLTGAGKRARHVKLHKAEQIEAPALRALLEASVAITPSASR